MSEQEPFDVTIASGVTIASFRSSCAQLDESVVDSVNRKLGELTSGLKSPELILDMSQVKFFGSSFIEAMFRTWKRLQTRPDAKFALCGLTPYCREVLEITHLDKLWTLCATREEALSQFRSA